MRGGNNTAAQSFPGRRHGPRVDAAAHFRPPLFPARGAADCERCARRILLGGTPPRLYRSVVLRAMSLFDCATVGAAHSSPGAASRVVTEVFARSACVYLWKLRRCRVQWQRLGPRTRGFRGSLRQRGQPRTVSDLAAALLSRCQSGEPFSPPLGG